MQSVACKPCHTDHSMESLSALFSRASEQASTSKATSTNFEETLKLLQRCEQLVDTAALFSSNEEADDVHTEHLRYLLIPFLIAELHSGRATSDKQLRLEAATAAIKQYSSFLTDCARYGFLNPSLQQLHAAEERGQQLDPGSKRTAKIEQAKRTAELNRMLQQMEQMKLRDAPANKGGGDQAAGPVGGTAGWDEEDERRLWGLKLESAAISAFNALPALTMEVELCRMAAGSQQQQQQQQGGGPGRSAGAVVRAGGGAGGQGDAADKAAMAARLRDIAGQLAGGERQRLQQQVFRPSHTLPTITVEQQGVMEMREAQQRETASAAAAAAQAAAEAALTGEEREARARRKAATWDEFKDDNPYGSGNSKLRPCAL